MDKDWRKEIEVRKTAENDVIKLKTQLDELTSTYPILISKPAYIVSFILINKIFLGVSKHKEEESKTEISNLKLKIDEKDHIVQKLEKEAKRTQIQMDEQNERIIKLSKEVDDAQEEVRNIRLKTGEEKRKLLDEREQLNEKIQSLGIFFI